MKFKNITTRRRSITSILRSDINIANSVDTVNTVYELIKVLELQNRHLSLEKFILMLKDTIYTPIKFIFYQDFKDNAHKHLFNLYIRGEYNTHSAYYLYFLNYCYYYYKRIYENPSIKINKKIINYDNSCIIKKHINIFIEILDLEKNRPSEKKKETDQI